MKARLSVMMFLQYAVWGAWLPILARYLSATPAEGGLGFSGYQIGMIMGLAGSIGALVSPFFAGQLADRRFRTERLLAVLLVAGGVIKWLTALQTTFAGWLWLSVAYSLVFMPTLALSNSLAFSHLEDGSRDFPGVRLWGTVGWITAGWVFPMLWLQTDLTFRWAPPFLAGPEVADVTARLVDALKFSAILSFGYAAWCLALPATPPRREGVEGLAVAKAFRLFRLRSFAVLVAATLPISVLLNIYFLQTAPFLASIGLADSRIAPAMTIAQFAEIAALAVLGRMLSALGFRTVFFIGAVAYFLRFAAFGTTWLPLELIIASQLLHGLCFACCFAAGFIYVDRIAPPDIRHSAQTVYGIVILGLGPVFGGWLSGALQEASTTAGVVDYSQLWYTTAAIGLVTAVFFVTLFRDETGSKDEVGSG